MDIIVTRAEDATAIGASIRAAKNAGIPIITFDRQSKGLQPTAHVGNDGYEQGLVAARAFGWLLKLKGVQGKCIEIMGDLRDQNAVARKNAWAEVEEDLNAWETVAQVPTEWEPSKFRSGTIQALSANPEANCLYIHSDFAFNAVEKALQSEGKLQPRGEEGHMWIVSLDTQPQAVPAIEDGLIDVSVTWEAWYPAVEAVKVIGRIVAGQELEYQNYMIPGRLVTPDTINETKYLWSREYTD